VLLKRTSAMNVPRKLQRLRRNADRQKLSTLPARDSSWSAKKCSASRLNSSATLSSVSSKSTNVPRRRNASSMNRRSSTCATTLQQSAHRFVITLRSPNRTVLTTLKKDVKCDSALKMSAARSRELSQKNSTVLRISASRISTRPSLQRREYTENRR